MWKVLYRSILATVILVVIVSGVYPLAVYAIGRLFFAEAASGGIIVRDGKPVGARLIGQAFSRPEYFHGRPSAAGDKGYDAANSSGSNLGPTNQKLRDTLQSNVDSFLKDNPTVRRGEIPPDLVTSSGSGLDPDISPEGAFVQINRVARARGVSPDELRMLVERHLEGPQLGIFGEPVVNVLLLNLDLDSHYPQKSGG